MAAEKWISGVALMAALAIAGGKPAIADDCNVEHGAEVAKRCVACHAFDIDAISKVGPPLAGVVGRQAASYPDFKYSRALRAITTTWTAEELDKFLAAPQKYARGTSMAFAGLRKEEERADLICFLQTLSAATTDK